MSELVERTATTLDCGWCVLSDMDVVGGEGVRQELLNTSSEVQVRELVECSKLLRLASQVVWASVFLCRSEQEAVSLLGEEDYVDSLRKCRGIVRAIDGAEFFVHVPVEVSLGFFGEREERRELPIEELHFPE